MKAKFYNFPSYRKKLAEILSRIAPHRDKLPHWAVMFFDSSCVEFFSIIPPVIFTDIERYDTLVEIYELYIKRCETV